MFRGNHPTRVDEKGRLKMPADFKAQLQGEESQRFYITSKDGKRAQVYPLKAWEEIESKLAKIPDMNPAKQAFLDVTSYYGQMAEMDGQGRILIPQILRESAKIGAKEAADVVVFGKMSFLEVANREGFEAEMKPLSLEHQSALSDLGL